MMDGISRDYFEVKFERDFLLKKAGEFQDFFSSIMEKGYPSDFTRVLPFGNVGDRKNDGYLKSKRMLFQVYGPNELKSAKKTISKIEKDFNGALPYWKEHFDTWIFVHNSRRGLGPDVLKKLLDLGKANPSITIENWGFEELHNETFRLNENDLASLLGAAPSLKGMVNLGLADLAPVLDQLALLQPSDDPDLRPVPADKLQRNLLSNHVANLLKAGMSRADLFPKYFRGQPSKQDQLAQTFRMKYRALWQDSAAPDEIFAELQRFAGGSTVPSAARQNAILAVLAYFFEVCEIFERPEAEEATT